MTRRSVVRVVLVLTGAVLLPLLVAELGLRLWNPLSVQLFSSAVQGDAGERVVMVDETREVHPKNGLFEPDEVLGYRPVLGGKEYAPSGARWNDYALEKPVDRRRLLFLGDSVTARHKLVDALRELLGDGYEFWNGGVIGYATQQELVYYRDHLATIAADHVVLTFHLNDFETTPIMFQVGDSVALVHSRVGTSHPNPWLLRNSYVYRFAWGLASRWTSAEREQALAAEVASGLEALRDLVRARGAEFTVLVLPWIQERAKWPADHRRHHEETLRTLERLGIRHYAFLDVLDRAVAEGVPIHENKADPQHPSAEFARLIARSLLDQGFRP